MSHYYLAGPKRKRKPAASRGDKAAPPPVKPPEGETPSTVAQTLKKVLAIASILESWTPQDVGIDDNLLESQIGAKAVDYTPAQRAAMRNEFNNAAKFFNVLGKALQADAGKMTLKQKLEFLKTPIGEVMYSLYTSRGGISDTGGMHQADPSSTRSQRRLGMQYLGIVKLRSLMAPIVAVKDFYMNAAQAANYYAQAAHSVSASVGTGIEQAVQLSEQAGAKANAAYKDMKAALTSASKSVKAAALQAQEDLIKFAVRNAAKAAAQSALEKVLQTTGFKPQSSLTPQYQPYVPQAPLATAVQPWINLDPSFGFHPTPISQGGGAVAMSTENIPSAPAGETGPPPEEMPQTQPPEAPTVDWGTVAGLLGLADLGLSADRADEALALYYDMRSRGVDKIYPVQMRNIYAALSSRNYASAYSQVSTLVGTVYQQSPEQRFAIIRGQVPATVPGPTVYPVPGEYHYDYSSGYTVITGPTGEVIYSGAKPQNITPAGVVNPAALFPAVEEQGMLPGILLAGAVVGGLIFFMRKDQKKPKSAVRRRRS